MLTTPVIIHQKKRYYAAISKNVLQRNIPEVLPPLIDEILSWLSQHNISPAGPCFFNYISFNSKGEMQTEAGVPVDAPFESSENIICNFFPAGDYAAISHFGDYKFLINAHMALEKWIKDSGLKEQTTTKGDTVEWGSRAEFYVNDMEQEPDVEKWQTDVLFLLH